MFWIICQPFWLVRFLTMTGMVIPRCRGTAWILTIRFIRVLLRSAVMESIRIVTARRTRFVRKTLTMTEMDIQKTREIVMMVIRQLTQTLKIFVGMALTKIVMEVIHSVMVAGVLENVRMWLECGHLWSLILIAHVDQSQDGKAGSQLLRTIAL